MPRVKRTPVDAKRVSQFFLDGAEDERRKRQEKKEEEKPAIKGRRAAERGGKGGGRVYVTFDRTRKHNKSSEGWKRGGTRILFFIRSDAVSVSLLRTGRERV